MDKARKSKYSINAEGPGPGTNIFLHLLFGICGLICASNMVLMAETFPSKPKMNVALGVIITNEIHPDCEGGIEGSAEAVADGGVMPYTYTWSNGLTDAIASNLIAGKYTVTVTDLNGDQATASIVLSNLTGVEGTIIASTEVTCFGGDNGSATVQAFDGTPPYAYQWSSSAADQITAKATNLPAGEHTVTITDNDGCQVAVIVVIGQPTLLFTEIVATTDETCKDENDGTATVNTTGGTPPYTYLWSNNDMENIADDLKDGISYSVSVTDASGCTTIVTGIGIDEPDRLKLSVEVKNLNCHDGADGGIDLTVDGGTAPYLYEWERIFPFDGATPADVEDPQHLIAGIYRVTVTDAHDCDEKLEVEVHQPLEALSAALNITDVKCEGSSDGTITVSAAGGVQFIEFLGNPGEVITLYLEDFSDQEDAGVDGNPKSCSTGDDPMIDCSYTPNDGKWIIVAGPAFELTQSDDNLDVQDGELSARDLDGTLCFRTIPIDISQVTSADFSLKLLEDTNLDSEDGYSVNYSVDGGLFINVEEVSNDFDESEVVVTGITGSTLVIEVCITNTGSNDIIRLDDVVVTGTLPLTYAPPAPYYIYCLTGQGLDVTQQDPFFTGLTEGVYQLQVKDANGCIIDKIAFIAENEELEVDVSSNGPLCVGDNLQFTTEVSGGLPPYTYSWSGPGFDILNTEANPTINAVNSADGGTYLLEVMDANGCTVTASIEIAPPSEVIASVSTSSDVTCFGGADGSATLSASGGVTPYHYLWSNGSTDQIATGLPAGNYMVTITDANGCEALAGIMIKEPATAVSIEIINRINPDCEGNTDGSAEGIASDGVEPYSYVWSDGQTGEQAINLSAGTYNVTATDANGCQAVATIVLTDPTGLEALIISSEDVTCNGGNDGAATVLASGGTVPYTYLWSLSAGSQTEDIAVNLPPGEHAVTVIDANGCEAIGLVQIDEPTQLVAEIISKIDESCNGNADGEATVLVTGGSPPYTYDWNNDGTGDNDDALTANGLAVGDYEVRITDAHDCIINALVTIAPGVDLTIEPIADIGPLCSGEKVPAILLSGAPNNADIVYTWIVNGDVGLISGETTGLNPSIPSFIAADGKGSAVVMVTASLGEEPGICTDYKTFMITIDDNEKPEFISCPQNILVGNAPDLCGAYVNWNSPAAIDNCDGLLTPVISQVLGSGSFFTVGNHMVEYIATDASGNAASCSFTITVQDNELPIITCPLGFVTFDTDSDHCYYSVLDDMLDAVASDNCSLVSLTHDYSGFADKTTLTGANFPIGLTNVTWIAVDAASKETNCSIEITVKDNIVPIVTDCPADMSFDNDAGLCGAIVNYHIPLFKDNCDGDDQEGTLVQGLASGKLFPVGETIVSYTYSDAAGNGPVYCTFMVTVEDGDDPEITCPDNIVVGADGSIISGGATIISTGPCGVTLSYEAPEGRDNCGDVEAILTGGVGAAPNYYQYAGTYTETYKVVDAAENYANCSFTIMVEDPVVPMITCPQEDIVVDNELGLCSAVVIYATPIGTDNCPGYKIELTNGLFSGSAFAVGTREVKYTITDNALNSVSCSFNVTVNDVEDPVIITCPPNQEVSTLTGDADDCSGVIPDLTGILSATDNCLVASIMQSPAAGTSFDGVHGDEKTMIITVSDEAGNTTTCEVILTLVDEESPQFDCPVNRNVLTSSNGEGDCIGIIPNLVTEVSATDNCFESNELTITQNPGAATLFSGVDGEVKIVTITVEDPGGNVSTCDVTLTLTDDEAPVITTCPSAQFTLGEEDDNDNCISIVPDLTGEVVAQDNCFPGPALAISQNPTAGTIVNGEVGEIIMVTIFVTDPQHNTTSCDVELTILDGVLPVILSCAPNQDVFTSNNGTGDGTADVPDLTGMVNAVDPCNENGILIITQNPLAGTSFAGGTGDELEVVITVADAEGNSTNCSTILTLIDDEVPTIIECATQQATINSIQGVDECLVAIPNLMADVIVKDNTTLASDLVITQSPIVGTRVNSRGSGDIIVTFTVTDENQNTITCQTMLTMLDTNPPVITECARDQDVPTSSDGTGDCQGVVPDLTDEVIAEDACTNSQGLTITQIPQAGTLFGSDHEDELEVIITVTDEAGNHSTCPVTLRLVDDEDPGILCANIPRELYINNYEDNVHLVEGNTLDPTWSDNCTITLSHNYPDAPFSYTLGNGELPVGETVVIWKVTDENNNTDECTVVYHVNEEPCAGQLGLNLACNDQIYVSVGPSCESLITADMILEGMICVGLTDDYFIIRVVGDDADETTELEDKIANGIGTFIVEILPRDPENFPIDGWLGCWGYVTVEDKSPPLITNFDEYEEELFRVKRDIQAQVLTGQISNNHREGTINISNYSCFIEDSPYPNCQRPYQTVTFTIDKTDIYTIELDIDGSEDGMLALFRGSFNPDNPCENIIFHNNEGKEDDPNVFPGPGGIQDGLARMVLPLSAGDTYVALITYDDCVSSSDIDPYSITLYADNGGRATSGFGEVQTIQVCRDLLCNDVNFVRSQSAYALEVIGADNGGRPLFDDCTLKRVWYEDGEVSQGDACEDIYFYRTWRAIDESGRQATPVTQKIIFRRPTLEDVYRPAKTVPIECDELQSEFLDVNGNPSPAITGYPFIVSAFGIHDLKTAYCNLGASYEDIGLIVTCGEGKKVIRQWTLIDWCDIPGQDDLNNSELYNHRQIIKVGDFSPPVITQLEDMTISTGPFNCEGVMTIPSPEVTDNCSNFEVIATVYRIEEIPLVDRFGRLTGEISTIEEIIHQGIAGDVLTNIEKGIGYKVRYRATDVCGNITEPMEIDVVSQDDTKPVAVCDDDLHISIGGDGIGRISSKDVDEGSWDNCGEVEVYISRKLASESTRDAYLDRIYGLVMADLYSSIVLGPDSRMEVWKTISDDIEVIYKKEGMWYTWWDSELYFLCEDIDDRYITVELLAIDGDGTVESYLNGEANGNLCWLDILVEDKLHPQCVAPRNITLTCIDLPYGFNSDDDTQLVAMFGNAEIFDNCLGGTAVQISKTVDLDCGEGTIIRVFQATDNRGYTSTNHCTQVITIHSSHDYEIKFPKDVQADCVNPTVDTVMVRENGCDLLTINIQEERFDVVAQGSACYKIKRTYRVMNWCEYDGVSDPVIVGRDEDCDGEKGEDDIYVLVRTNDVTYYDQDNNENVNPAHSPCVNGAQGHLKNSMIDGDIISVGFWEYTQYIKVYDTSAPEVRIDDQEDVFCSLDNVDCKGDVIFPLLIADVCADEKITLKVFFIPDLDAGLQTKIDMQDPVNATAFEFRLEGTYPNYTMSGRFPLGNHKFEVHVQDACGNEGITSVDFRVVDCKAPAPICINGLAIELMPVEGNIDIDGDGDEDPGAVSIWASDFKVSNTGDCSGPIKLSVNRVGQDPNPSQKAIILTCDDLDTVVVEVYAWDSAYNPKALQPDGTLGGPNYDFCQTYILIRDGMFGLCDELNRESFAGLITTEEDETMENVEVYLSGHVSKMMMTPVTGAYTFSDLPPGNDYTITSVKDNDYLNGISTYDLVLITKHILGKQRLDSPYKMIAADVNKSGTISTLDLIQLRKLVLGVKNDLPGNTSWRFVPAAYNFPDRANPWLESFPETINYNNIEDIYTGGDFIAIKIGDVNGSAKSNSHVSEFRSLSGVFYLQLDEQELNTGNEYRVSFMVDELEDIQGYQFTLEFDTASLDLLDIEYGVATAEHFGMNYLKEGVITTSWNQAKDQSEKRDMGTKNLVTLVFRANANAKLSELISINSKYTLAEAYNINDETLDVALRFNNEKQTEARFELFQNRPNPFRESTVISFYLPEASEATLTIHDATGRSIKVIRAVYQQGYQQIQLKQKELPTSGILYYRLKTGDYSATKKMILVNE